MSYSLTKQQNPGASIFYDPGFLNVLNEHIPYFLYNDLYGQITIEPNTGLKYKGDFNGLLTHLKIPHWHHICALWLNRLDHPSQYDGRNLSIILPSQDALVELMRMYQIHHKTKRKK